MAYLCSSDSEADTESGYECSFVNEVPDTLLCLICTYPARDPQQVTCCGKIFCKFCLDTLKSKSSRAPCSNCRSKRWEKFPDKRSLRDILFLKVKCSLSESECHWEGNLRDLDDHLETCSHEPIPCVYASVGCKATFYKHKLDEHNATTDHLAMAIGRISLLSDLLDRVKLDRVEENKRLPPVVFKMKEFGYHRENELVWNSPPFYTHPRGYTLYLKISFNGVLTGFSKKREYVSVHVCLMHGECDDDLPWPFRGVVSFMILNQEDDSNHIVGKAKFSEKRTNRRNRRVTAEKGRSDVGYGADKLLCLDDLRCDCDSSSTDEEDIEEINYIQHDTLCIRVSQATVSKQNKPWLI